MDNLLAFSHFPKIIMKDIGFSFDIKDDKFGPPTTYLGTNVEPFQISDRKYAWIIQYNSYVAAAVQTIKDLFSEYDIYLRSNKISHTGLLPHGYKAELDVTDECDSDHVSRFQQLIGILRWEVELVQIDTQIEVSFL